MNKATATQIATFKRLARKSHAMGCDRMYGECNTKAEIKFNERLKAIDETLEEIESNLSPEQVESLQAWAYENELYGILGTC